MKIHSRTEWGARHRAGFGARKLPTAECFLHHTVMAAPTTLAAERAAMRALEKIGQDRFGGGVSYNLVVMPSGRVYEGCGVARVGAHTAGRNTVALAIALAGNYDTAKVPAPMRAALVELLRHAHAAGWIGAPRFTGGHRDAPRAATACPGRHAYALLAEINRAAAAPARPVVQAAAVTPPAPLTPSRGPAMLIVLSPVDNRQFVCDVKTAEHITGPERGVLIAAGVPYVGPEHPAAQRREFLERRGVKL